MKTLLIVKHSKLYHIYNGEGERVAILASREDIHFYIKHIFCPPLFTSYTLKPTVVAGTFIVTVK
ncbi:hypothetical protein [Hymenobacter terricola]|uniref:hypothetical protein n=1 Tax=Hymenobacter terricola TaxID=2819236 RepID=UPI001B3137DE|nr:hypothetical protein [Hymenobacter terricola]